MLSTKEVSSSSINCKAAILGIIIHITTIKELTHQPFNLIDEKSIKFTYQE